MRRRSAPLLSPTSMVGFLEHHLRAFSSRNSCLPLVNISAICFGVLLRCANITFLHYLHSCAMLQGAIC